MTSLLVLTSDPEGFASFEPHVDELTTHSLAEVNIRTDADEHVHVQDTPVSGFDAVFLDPAPRTTIFAKIMLEYLAEHQVACNLDASTLFITAKKSYLFKVLDEKGVPLPKTAALSTDRGVQQIDEDIGFPLIATKYDGFRRVDIDRMENVDSLNSFAEHTEHGTHYLTVQAEVAGDVYDVLYLDGDIISLKVEGEGWRQTPKKGAAVTYHNLGGRREELVQDAAAAIGTDCCRVRLVGDHVIDVNSRLALPRFQEESGKDVYGAVVDLLVGGDSG